MNHVDDHGAGRMDFSISVTRWCNPFRVSCAMPLTPIADTVIDAQATPHTNASCRPPTSPPVLIHRASIPPASASPAPVVSTAGGCVWGGILTTAYSGWAARPSAPALTTRPFNHHCRRNSSGSFPPSAASSSWLQKNQPALRSTSLASGGRDLTYDSMASAARKLAPPRCFIRYACRSGRIEPTNAPPSQSGGKTGAMTLTGTIRLAASAKYTAEPPSTSSTLPNGPSRVSSATEPATSS